MTKLYNLLRFFWRMALRAFYSAEKLIQHISFQTNQLLCYVAKSLPVSSRYIMFESEIDFSENSRAIYDYMISNMMNDRYHLIWSVHEPNLYEKRKNVVFIKRNKKSIIWNYYLGRCKFFIFTHPYWLKEWKKDQYVINVWHGNPFKAPPIDKMSHVFDVILASSDDGVKYRKKEFDGEFEIAVLGAPRVDWLFQSEDFLSRYTNGIVYKKAIFCMPTYKQSKHNIDSLEKNQFGINTIKSQEELKAFNCFLQENEVIIVFLTHHLQLESEYENLHYSNILFIRDRDYANDGLVMNQLLTCADALITDFSGVFIDYLLLDRPIGFLCNSIEDYSRGFAMDNPSDYMAGEKLYTTDDLKKFIINLLDGHDDYQLFRKEVRDRCHKYQDANNSKRFLEYFRIT